MTGRRFWLWVTARLDAKMASRPFWIDPLPVVCAWCQTSMRDGRGPVSHGICPACITRFEQQAQTIGDHT